MVIGIDANEANVSKRVGISEYAYQILEKLYEFRKNGENKHSFLIYLKSKPLEVLPKPTDWWSYKVVGPSKFWTQLGLPFDLYLSKIKPEIFLTLTHYAPRYSPVPTVVSVMDLSFLHFPQTFKKNDLYQLTKWTEYSVKNARKIITISNSSKDDIIKFYKVPEEKVKVVYLGLKSLTMEKGENSLKDFGIEKPFILFVGTLQPRKNIEKLIEAFSLIKEPLKEKYQLVIIGKKGWLFEDILEAPKNYGVEDKVKFLDYINDNDLPLFYKEATLFVLPSLYEGFGLPVLEAMRYECPVITSNFSSLPEAGGDAAIYFDPQSERDIKNTIEKVLEDKDLRMKMVKKGSEHIKKFTWDKAARDVLISLEEVGKK